ncbi:trace amine-associated receptor 6-like [Clarias gariepinus]|uniref:trace amine-associated receptor 6-like n=1 Tax=Clarias gariepinus TaxID=13013 RepID=UPI00234CB9D4|nr:trace amine-associated receptor 6-like [Clarias gariepinus]
MKITELNQSDHCVYFFCPERSVSPAVYVFLYMGSAAVVLLTVCGNLLVIISVLHFKQLHTPTNMLILSLAVSDLLVGILLMPPTLIWTIESCWIFGRGFCTGVWLIAGVLLTVSIYNVVLISVDRYLALFIHKHSLYKNDVQHGYMKLSERKAAKVLGILVSVFLVCLLPYFIYSLLGGIIELQLGIIQNVLIMLYLNSTINPIVYALFYPWFRKSFQLVITLHIFQTDSALINVIS